MTHRAGCGAARRVTVILLSVGLSGASFIVPWLASDADASAPAITNYTEPSFNDAGAIAVGSDGALWYTLGANASFEGDIGRISTAGVFTNYTGDGTGILGGIAAGSDGALWFTNPANNAIGRITTSGV